MINVNFRLPNRYTMSSGSDNSKSKCPGLKRFKTEWNLVKRDEPDKGTYRCCVLNKTYLLKNQSFRVVHELRYFSENR